MGCHNQTEKKLTELHPKQNQAPTFSLRHVLPRQTGDHICPL